MKLNSEAAEDMDVLRRRAAYRAHHRGSKEMDVLVGRYADARLAAFSASELACFERLLATPDPVLQWWIVSGPDIEASEFETLIADMRAFHGLQGKSATQL
jgi:antitoxin CptB